MCDFVFKSGDIASKNLKVYNARKKPFSIHGLYRPEEEGLFRRMPTEDAEKVNKKIVLLHTNTSGARLRFVTDSTFVAVGAIYPEMEFATPASALLSCACGACFDMYVDGKHKHVLLPKKLKQIGSAVTFDLEDGIYEASSSFSDKRLRQITLCFPTYINVSGLFIGLDPDAVIKEATPYANDKPVVFYGSSITQGACASHSGNIYQNVLSRRFNFDYINLGFSGACKAEDAMIDYLCSLEMSMLVFDYDHNTPNPEHLERTHLPALRRLRAAHPDIPFVLMSKPNRHSGKREALERRAIIERNYRILSEEYSAPVHFVDGQKIFESYDSEMMTVDNTHPNDFGFFCMAEAMNEIFEIYF